MVKDLKHDHSIVCCLRGGTVFVVPVVPLSNNNDDDDNNNNDEKQQRELNEVVMYQFPHDTDGGSDGLMRYVQGFTAGYVIVKTCGRTGIMDHHREDNDDGDGDSVGIDTNDHRSTTIPTTTTHEYRAQPLLFHAWSGGIIDVHACGLSILDNLHRRNTATTIVGSSSLDNVDKTDLVRRLVTNGTVKALVSLLLSLLPPLSDEGEEERHSKDSQDGGGDDALMLNAARECRSLGADNDSSIITNLLYENGVIGLHSFNKVLHHLVTGSGGSGIGSGGSRFESSDLL